VREKIPFWLKKQVEQAGFWVSRTGPFEGASKREKVDEKVEYTAFFLDASKREVDEKV